MKDERIMKKKHHIARIGARGLRLLPMCLFVALLLACTQIDCPLNNRVYATYRFYDHFGDSVQLYDSLTITTTVNGQEDTLINKLTNHCSFMMPMSYSQREDEYHLEIKGEDYVIRDTIRVTKEDFPHFESVDCNPAFFHTAKDVMCTHNIIDSVVINNKKIDYDSNKEHFKIYVFTGY